MNIFTLGHTLSVASLLGLSASPLVHSDIANDHPLTVKFSLKNGTAHTLFAPCCTADREDGNNACQLEDEIAIVKPGATILVGHGSNILPSSQKASGSMILQAEGLPSFYTLNYSFQESLDKSDLNFKEMTDSGGVKNLTINSSHCSQSAHADGLLKCCTYKEVEHHYEGDHYSFTQTEYEYHCTLPVSLN